MHATETLEEADRLMTVCNSCRYCEGLCAVFPAMEMRRSFADGDLNYLANLCHGCGACYVDCQFAPPHEFAVNVPLTLARARADSYRSYAWPAFMQPMFDRNGLAIALIAMLAVAGMLAGFVLWHDAGALFATDGQFYRLMPHHVMVALFGAVSVFVVVALGSGFRNFWRDTAPAGNIDGASLWQAVKDAGSLRYLDGGGVGCHNEDERPSDTRRLHHHLAFWGFMLCFAATSTATVFHYVFGMPAPYAWYELPKLLGTAGGIALVVGAAGLLRAKFTRDPAMVDRDRFGMDAAFVAMLLLTGLSGLLLMVLRETAAMGILLSIHLGSVLALFLTMPYGKFVHGLYRFGALARYAWERRGSA